jgi:aspartyl-tRNA(Asn)/glutamyl-tRNA(Gln) amidotransferase subunit C
MPEALTRAEVAHVAKLARLALNDAELATMTDELGGILAHANEIAALDLTGVLPTAHPMSLKNVFREDVVRASASRVGSSGERSESDGPELRFRDEVLAAAPLAEDRRFRVPKILSEGE